MFFENFGRRFQVCFVFVLKLILNTFVNLFIVSIKCLDVGNDFPGKINIFDLLAFNELKLKKSIFDT